MTQPLARRERDGANMIVRGDHVRIGLVGDRDDDILAHRAVPLALRIASRVLDVGLETEWIATDEITTSSRVAAFHGVWCVPGSSYRSADGALIAIEFARKTRTPLFSTCGAFQYVLVEYARNVLGWVDAVHAEEAPPGSGRAVISSLRCSLLEASEVVLFTRGSRVAAAYGGTTSIEAHHCRFGLDDELAKLLKRGPLRVTARNRAGEARGVELATHPFFVATLFQPERAALAGEPVPLANLFAAACADAAAARAS